MKDSQAVFGANLKIILAMLDMSQAELAKRTGLTPAAISMLLAGEREPTLSTIVKILNVIPIKFEGLMKGLP